MKVSEVL